jgi:hypothetical protein
MNPFAIPALLSVFGAVLGFQGGSDQKDYARQQERLAQENAALGRRELEEQVRRQNAEDMRLRGSLLARQAASGAEVGSGTNLTNAEYMEEEQARELNWMRTSGASKIRLELESEMIQADITRSQGEDQQWSSIIGGAIGAFTFAEKGGMLDWDSTTTALGGGSYAKSASGFRIAPGGGYQ